MYLSFRNATQNDAALTHEIEKYSINQYADFFYENSSKMFNHDNIQIIELANKGIGYLEIEEKNHSFEIINILIHKDYQNKGFGKYILQNLIRESQLKSKSIELQVLKNNPKAKRFYENSGFQVYHETDFEYKMKHSCN